MGIEIERKFLIKDMSILLKAEYSYIINQCYLNDNTRIRFELNNNPLKAYMVLKSAGTDKIRNEWNFEIPVEEAIDCCEKLFKSETDSKEMSKTRHILHEGPTHLKW